MTLKKLEPAFTPILQVEPIVTYKEVLVINSSSVTPEAVSVKCSNDLNMWEDDKTRFQTPDWEADGKIPADVTQYAKEACVPPTDFEPKETNQDNTLQDIKFIELNASKESQLVKGEALCVGSTEPFQFDIKLGNHQLFNTDETVNPRLVAAILDTGANIAKSQCALFKKRNTTQNR